MRNNGILLIIATGVAVVALLPAPPPQTTPAPRPSTANPSTRKSDTKTESVASDLKLSPADTLSLHLDPALPTADTTAELTVRNASLKDSYSIIPSLSSFGFTRDSKPVPTDTVLGIEGVGRLSPGDGVRLVLRAKNAMIDPGNYEGTLLIKEAPPAKAPGNPREFTRQTVRVTVAEPIGPIQPLVSKLSLRAYRTFPFFGNWIMLDRFGTGIPLRTKVDPIRQGLTHDPRLGVLTRDPAGLASISWRKDADLAKDNPALNLELSDAPFAGKYEGTLTFGAPTVQITLNASDFIFYPLAWLAIAIWFATAAKRWLGGDRQLTEWRANILTSQLDMKTAEEKFASFVTGSAKHYSLQVAFNTQCQELFTQIQSLEGTLLNALDTTSPGYQAVSAAMLTIGSTPKMWLAFGERLNGLTASALTLDPSPPYPLGFTSIPRIQDAIADLLSPKQISLTQFASLQDSVLLETDFVVKWNDLWNTVAAIYDGLPAVKETDYATAHPDELKAFDDQLNVARAQLWTITGLDAAANKDVVATANTLYIAYSKLLEAAKFATAQHKSLLRVPGQESAKRQVAPMTIQETDPEQTLAALKAKERESDWALGGLSFVLAILTGLNQYYFGKPFGTVSDYVAITVWAFGTKIAVDALSGGLERWFGSQRAGG